MSHDTLAQQLHDKATRGGVLTAAEQAQLDTWYAQQDQEESATFASTQTLQSLSELQAQVAAAVAQLQTVTQRIQVLIAENEAVRREIAALHDQLAHRPTPSSA